MKPTLGVQPQLEIWDVHSQNTFVQCPELSPHAANSNYFSPAAAGQAQRAVECCGHCWGPAGLEGVFLIQISTLLKSAGYIM